MPRALTLQRAMVPAIDRAKYLAALRHRRAHYHNADCRFWVFEEAGLPGLFIEFVEANDAETLRAAHARAPERLRDPSRVYTEVEIA
ncbi:MAG TPA: hypothetical protein VE967_12410 [Gemmatimonadaceae bacterium]|nr:hypothetical protein [Gemmatimonadaceae bacterium]